MRVVWTPQAKENLSAIADRLAGFSGQTVTEIRSRFVRRTRQLEDFPASGRMVPEFELPSLRELLEDDYRLIYEITPDAVEVIAVVHAARYLGE